MHAPEEARSQVQTSKNLSRFFIGCFARPPVFVVCPVLLVAREKPRKSSSSSKKSKKDKREKKSKHSKHKKK